MAARTGKAYIEGLQDGRRIYVNGELVRDVTQYPGYRGIANELAKHYDRHHEAGLAEKLTYASPKDEAPVSNSFLYVNDSNTLQQRIQGERLRCEHTYGLMGRLPDFMNAWVTDMARVPHVLGAKDPQFAQNAVDYYEYCRDQDICMTHTLL